MQTSAGPANELGTPGWTEDKYQEGLNVAQLLVELYRVGEAGLKKQSAVMDALSIASRRGRFTRTQSTERVLASDRVFVLHTRGVSYFRNFD